ncbi:MAG: type 1 glutamine amidotransferase [bacterium]
MKKEILILKNISREGPGLIEDVLIESGLAYSVIDLSENHSLSSLQNYNAIIVLGGPDSANDTSSKILEELKLIRRAINLNIPYLGICLGMQMLVKAVGGKVVKNPVKEVGFSNADGDPYTIELTQDGMFDPLFANLKNSFNVFQLHGETVIPTNEINVLATGKHCVNQVIKLGTNAYGIQCHFELTEDLLNVWTKEDDDLKLLDRVELITNLNEMKSEYTSTGKQLIKNFLKIVGYELNIPSDSY